MHGVSFDAYNVLEDEELRSGIKEYSSWPTIPQIFFKGDFIGGCDILLEMHRNGELVEELEKIGVKSKLAEEEKLENAKNKFIEDSQMSDDEKDKFIETFEDLK